MPDKNLFSVALKAYRLNNLWTIQEVADVTKVSISTLSDIENGKRSPSDLTRAKILRALPDLLEAA